MFRLFCSSFSKLVDEPELNKLVICLDVLRGLQGLNTLPEPIRFVLGPNNGTFCFQSINPSFKLGNIA